MTWSDFYLICFLVGFGLSALAFLAGSVHLHLPHLHLASRHHMPHARGRARRSLVVQFRHHRRLFGLVRRHGVSVGALLPRLVCLALGIATLSGIGAAAVVFWFLAKVLMSREKPSTRPITTWSGCSAA
jgi:hypothetical protein